LVFESGGTGSNRIAAEGILKGVLQINRFAK
jgi:hypothetical protein